MMTTDNMLTTDFGGLKFDDLLAVADPESITGRLTSDARIVKISFTVHGIRFKCQYDADTSCLYAFRMTDDSAAKDVLAAVKLCYRGEARCTGMTQLRGQE